MTDQKRYREMLKAMGWTNKDIANITGHSYGSIRNATRPGGDFPRHFLLAIEVYHKMKSLVDMAEKGY